MTARPHHVRHLISWPSATSPHPHGGRTGGGGRARRRHRRSALGAA